MAHQRPTPKSDWPDGQHFEHVFGPFAAADSGTNAYVLLPFMAMKKCVIQEVAVIASTLAASTAGVLSIAKGTVDASTRVMTAPSGALSATSDNRVTLGRQLDADGMVANRMERLPLIKGYANTAATANARTGIIAGDPTFSTNTAGGYNNVIEEGNQLYAHFDVAVTSLAGLYIKIRYTERVN